MRLTDEQLTPILAAYDDGQMLRAFALSRAHGPLAEWRGPAARVLAGRLAMNLGGARLGRVLHKLAWRQDPSHAEACYYYARALFESHGPLRTWEFMSLHGDLTDDASPVVRADWFALRASISGALRDFETGEAWLARAEALGTGHPWMSIERSHLLERQDRYPEALAAARRSLELRPWYRPGVQSTAHLLQLLDRDDEALDLLREASVRLENGPITMQLAQFETELRHYPEARRAWDLAGQRMPLADKAFAKLLDARRSDAAYYCGDLTAAAELAKSSESKFHAQMVERLSAAAAGGDAAIDATRVLLPVAFVRQHHMTCAPATLTALSRFWQMPVEHLSVAEEICYDGTPAHGERSWAEQNGYVVAEFTVDWASSRTLLDRGVPFTLTTVETTSAHLQAVIGYDALRGTLLIRDPFERGFSEFLAGAMFERYASTGPRGMAMVPAARAEELLGGGLSLPDRALYDAFHEVQRALVAHRREDALAACDGMEASSPEHRLTNWARRSLAAYDADSATALACIERQLAKHPNDNGLILARLGYLRALARRDDRVAQLRETCDRKRAEPVFWVQLAQEIRDDAREHVAAERLLRRALRYYRNDAVAYSALAQVMWDEPARREHALALYRWAACADEKNEGHSRSYFAAARHFKRTDEVLRMLRDRVARFGTLSPGPAQTLFWAYDELDRTPEAFAALEAALAEHPDDGPLRLYAATAYSRYGRGEQAAAMLASARDRTQHTHWLRVAADIDAGRGALADACDRWRRVVEAEPLSVDANRRLAQLLAETAGRPAAMAHVAGAAARFPHHYGLHQLWIEWARDDDDELTEPAPREGEPARTTTGLERYERAARRLMDIHPADAWVRRELVDCLLRQNRVDEALAEAEGVRTLDPENPSSHFYRGRALVRAGRLAEGREAYRDAVRRSVDFTWAAEALLGVCDSNDERKAELEFVRLELIRQTIFGDALLAFRRLASNVLDPEAVLAMLREALAARPDLWHAHSALVRQLIDLDRKEEALSAADVAIERFPLLPMLWVDMATARRIRNEPTAERAALARALEISPGWSMAGRRLADAHERAGELEQAAALLERIAAHAPLDPYTHGALADLYWKLGRRDEAIARAERAALLEPGFEDAWAALRRFGAEAGRPDAASSLARRLTARRPGSANAWMVLAENLDGKDAVAERLAAIDRAVTLNPRFASAHDLRASILAEEARYEEALAACAPAAWQGRPVPVELSGRAAWIEARRGDLPRAISLMRDAVASSPGYYWGWTRLCDWLADLPDNPGYLKAATDLAHRWPHDAPAHGYLGDALRRSGDLKAAQETFEVATRLSPEYAYGASQWFELALEEGDLKTAGAALQLLKLHSPGETASARAVQLAARKHDREGALAALAELCAKPTGTWAMERAVEAIEGTKFRAECDRVFREALKRPESNPLAAWFWPLRHAKREAWRPAFKAVDQILAGCDGKAGPRGRNAVKATFVRAGEKKQGRRVLRMMKRHRELLRSDDVTWGMTGAALETLGRPWEVIQWMSDWRQHAERQPWMLLNLAVSYRRQRLDEAAREVSQDALGRPGEEDKPNHRIWLAADAAAGACVVRQANPAVADAAVSLLQDVKRSELNGYYRFLFDIAHALVALARQDGAGRPPEQIRELLTRAEAAQPAYGRIPELKRFRGHLLRAVFRKYGVWRTPMWVYGLRSTPAPVATTRQGSPMDAKKIVWTLVAIVAILRLMAFIMKS